LLREISVTRATNVPEAQLVVPALSDFEQPPDSCIEAVAFDTLGENRKFGVSEAKSSP